MSHTRAEIDAELDRLARLTEAHINATPDDPHFGDEFAAITDELREHASPEDRAHVWSRAQCILRDAGLIPGDDEPCSD